MNDFDMYKLILEVIADKNPQDFQELLDEAQHYQAVKDYIASDAPNQFLIQDLQSMTISLINDGLISGIISPLKYVTLLKLNGLTVKGFRYLKKIREDDAKQQIDAILKSDNLTTSSKTLTQALSKLIF